jgi:hypothetical protein
MAEHVMETIATTSASPYTIYGEPGCFTVKFTSPHNTLHQFSGFKSEDDALAWIAETRVLAQTYR